MKTRIKEVWFDSEKSIIGYQPQKKVMCLFWVNYGDYVFDNLKECRDYIKKLNRIHCKTIHLIEKG